MPGRMSPVLPLNPYVLPGFTMFDKSKVTGGESRGIGAGILPADGDLAGIDGRLV